MRSLVSGATRSATWISGFFILACAYLSSWLPQLTWGKNQPKILPSHYFEFGPWERIPHIFNKWDVLRYTHIALYGYSPEDPAYLAFFPGWPIALRSFGEALHLSQPALGILSIPICLFLWAVALLGWQACLNEIPIFSERPNWRGGEDTRFIWFFAFYPTTLFNVVGYSESLFLAVSGMCLLSALRGQALSLFLSLAAMVLIKHIGVLVGLSIASWAFLFRPKLRLATVGYIAGLALVLMFYQKTAGDPFIWVKVQAAWGRHLSGPHAVILDSRGKAFELVFYAIYLFVGPSILAARVLKNKTFRPENWLPLFYTVAVLGPVWFGGSIQSIYRIIYLVPFLVALVPTFFSISRKAPWAAFLTLSILMNMHATYRYVADLFIN